MTLKELQASLEAIDIELQKLRRAEYEIPGETVFVISMRQYIVESIKELRDGIDRIILGLDNVDDVEKATMTIRERITGTARRLLTGKDE